jgi:DNA-binding response OmpR family regulator
MARILVIDDDESLLLMMALMLKRAGHEILQRQDARSGVEAVLSEPVDLVIVDVMMPEVNGYQVCSFLKQDARTQHIPVMILTALNEAEQRDNADDAGADAFLTKPVTLEILRTEVNRLLANAPRNTATA